VDYELTELGRSLLIPMKALVGWAEQNHPAITIARQRHETV
jgi:DNA-binding HxlR family transcriptional regulator